MAEQAAYSEVMILRRKSILGMEEGLNLERWLSLLRDQRILPCSFGTSVGKGEANDM